MTVFLKQGNVDVVSTSNYLDPRLEPTRTWFREHFKEKI